MTETSLKDLQSILRTQLGDDLIVESYVTNDLLPPGENYGSKLISVNAVVRRGKGQKSEDLNLVAKLPPPTQFQREMFDSPYTFRKEIFMYAEILPYYRKLEIDNGANERELVTISPDYYGSRLSMSPDVDFDDDAAILLENLKPRGYYCTERRYGCDLAHARLAVKAMARFHALGMVTKEKNPEFFETLKVRSKCLDVKNPEDWAKIYDQRLQDIVDDPAIAAHYDRCVRTVQSSDFTDWLAVPAEPWSTIIHSDFWANNVLFHDDDQGQPDDIKFVDYQNYLFLSPARELTFFLGSGLNDEAATKIDDLLELYYDTVTGKLRSLNCDTGAYSRETFHRAVKNDARIEFTHCLCMIKVLTMDVNADDPNAHNVKDLIENGDCGEAYRTRLRGLVNSFLVKGWLVD